MTVDVSITSGVVAPFILEVIKYIIRKFILKDMKFDFPVKFYAVAIPVLTILVEPFLALLGVEPYVVPTDLVEFTRKVLLVFVSAVLSVFTYNSVIKPTKEYARTLRG